MLLLVFGKDYIVCAVVQVILEFDLSPAIPISCLNSIWMKAVYVGDIDHSLREFVPCFILSSLVAFLLSTLPVEQCAARTPSMPQMDVQNTS